MAEKTPVASPIRGIRLFRIFGIQIAIDYSWFVIFFLLLWSLSAGYFPQRYPGYSSQAYWLSGLFATFLFFASVLIHELSHSVVALRSGLKISSITLFIFGGVSNMTEEPRSPGNEFKMAIAGPASSFVLAGIFWLIRTAIAGNQPPILVAIFSYLAYINLALGIFNLIPGFPLDGGRVFRSIMWKRQHSLKKATKTASEIGKGFAYGLMFLGGMQIIGGFLIGGLWFIFIGLFLRSAAEGSYRELVVRQFLDSVKIKDVMIKDFVSVDANMSVQKLISDYFLKYGYGGFPVEKNGRILGIVSLKDVTGVPEDRQAGTKVEDIMKPLDPEYEIAPEDSLTHALLKMQSEGLGRLMVAEDSKVTGMITRTGLFRFLEMKNILQH